MKTIDIIKAGVDRNFLRECERKGLISPQRKDSDWITDKRYKPREYSQEELEIVWSAYIYRKMGLSYEQIKKITNGNEIAIRDSISGLITKYENQIEELQIIIAFMKYVKGIGFVPSPPEKLMGSDSFKNYLVDFMNSFDENKNLKKILEWSEYMSKIDDIENVSDEMVKKLEDAIDGLVLNIDENDIEEYVENLQLLNDKLNLKPSCEEVQKIIHKMFSYQKKLENNSNLTKWDFASEYLIVLSNDSDMSDMIKNVLGEKTCEYLETALIEFLKIQEPDRIKKIVDNYSKNKINTK